MKTQKRILSNVKIGQLMTTGFFVCAWLILSGVNTAAQEKISGEWLVDFNRAKSDEVHLTLMRRTKNGSNMNGDGIALSSLQGLSRENAVGEQKNVAFRIVREAGTFEMEGSFRDGKGVGFWTLAPNQNFISAMRVRGYDNLTEENLFSAAVFDISTKLVEDLKSLGYDRLRFRELANARIFRVTPEFIREMKSAGYENLTMKDYVNARIYKVTPEFIRQMRAAGFANLTLKDFTDFRIYKVTPEFANEIKAEGFAALTPRDLINLRIYKVDAEYIRRVKSKGFPNVTLKELINMRIYKVAE